MLFYNLGLQVNLSSGRCDSTSIDAFYEPLVSLESLVSPTNVPTDMLTYEKSTEVHSIFDKAGDHVPNATSFLLPLSYIHRGFIHFFLPCLTAAAKKFY